MKIEYWGDDGPFHLPDDMSSQKSFDEEFTDSESGLVRTFRDELERHGGPDGPRRFFEGHGIPE